MSSSIEAFVIKGRGLVLSVPSGKAEGVSLGDELSLTVRVTGIEEYVKLSHPPQPGDTVGLVVTPVDIAKEADA